MYASLFSPRKTCTSVLWMFNRIGTEYLLLINCTLVIFLFIFFSLTEREKERALSVQKTFVKKILPLSEEDCQRHFIEKYFLTPREAEVFERMITTEEGIREMAEALYVSQRTFQRYITSIYEKTGTKSRMGLYQLYMDTKYNS